MERNIYTNSFSAVKWHRNLAVAVIEALEQIFNQNGHADKIIEKMLKADKRRGARDRGFIAETTYQVVRYKRLYATIASVEEPFSEADLWRLLGVFFALERSPLPLWKEFEEISVKIIRQRYQELSHLRPVCESIPDWLEERGVSELGEEVWAREIHALNQPAQVVLRTNTLHTTRKALQAALREEGIDTWLPDEYPDALVLEKRSNVFSTKAFKEGFFEVQDASSQLVAPFLEAMPAMRVVDACAGSGGKSLHLAALMQNKGTILALDTHAYKLEQLKKRARRNGVHTIATRIIKSSQTIKRLRRSAHRLLLDVPCSGLGVLRRNPDTKWKLQPRFLEETIYLQQQLLQEYSKMVKPGGKMVYATCSILPSENTHQIARFLQSPTGQLFVLEKEQQIYPSQSGFDGFYMALLKRLDIPY